MPHETPQVDLDLDSWVVEGHDVCDESSQNNVLRLTAEARKSIHRFLFWHALAVWVIVK